MKANLNQTNGLNLKPVLDKIFGLFSKGETYLNILVNLFALLFLYTASSKLLVYQNTELSMSKSPIITEFAPILVWMVPTIEIVISILLLVPKTVLIGLYAFFTLMVMFTCYIICILYYSSFVPCSCGGVISSLTWSQHLIFNTVFIVLAIIAIFIKTKFKPTNHLLIN
ncbi:MauE/DoxX family redox-associated membrane protein [Pedobacter sp. L105]|uniref:MauE/DoxX family redox-associated membrane protein n=1 Tax=Pedobacter sp. L105 TaxID=1641871 RepID=UPI003529EDB9